MLFKLSSIAAGTPDTTTAPATPDNHALILWISGVGVIAVGALVLLARKWMAHDQDTQDSQGTSIIRSWIAVSLVLALIVFCAATLLGSNTQLQNILFGGFVASTAGAIAFYFSSQGANEARTDFLNALNLSGQPATRPTAFTKITPPAGQVDQLYDAYQLKADGSPVPTYELTSGATLPPGLKLDPDGTLNGTPTAAGTFTFTVNAWNSAGPIPSPAISIVIAPAP